MISDRERANKYSEYLGLPPIDELAIDDFLLVMKSISLKHRGFFIIKIDGERGVRQYTFVLNLIQAQNISLRKDVENILDGIEFIFSQMENNGIKI
ncbi:hypothetical protein [Xanthomonas sacchari]|uniref:hypothetical protein n=1 Tax=Xanthomonas sacchari TaxID=56458 RepID=UPI00225DF4F8|nr:hypothetical protein [Xanthomonas sacchari]MCW0436731.1 hypothetical protein [Xanthomonas sacchari]